MAKYTGFRHQEYNLEMNIGESRTAAAITYVVSLSTTVLAVGSQAAGDSKTAIVSGLVALATAIACGLAGRQHDKDVRRLEKLRSRRLEITFQQ